MGQSDGQKKRLQVRVWVRWVGVKDKRRVCECEGAGEGVGLGEGVGRGELNNLTDRMGGPIELWS